MGLRLVKSTAANAYHGYNPYWFGRWRSEGAKGSSDFKLPVLIRGVPPASGKVSDTGDAAFEKSRKAALAALDKMRGQCRDKGANVHTLKTIYREQTGRNYEDVDLRLCDLAGRVVGRRNADDATGNRKAWAGFVASIFDAFADYAARHGRATLLAVDADFAKEYAKRLAKRYAWETVKKHVHRLSKAFARYLPGGFANPFDGVLKETKDEDHDLDTDAVSRKPLSDVELQALIEQARAKDETLYNITVCAVNTGMRLKDVCLLTWADVDLRRMLIKCKTHKTGARVTIPIMNGLRDALKNADTDTAGTRTVYAFPEAAARYLANPSGVARSGKTLFARALASLAGEEPAEADAPELTEPQRRALILAAIDAAPWNEEKRARIRANYLMLADGATYGDIAARTGWPKNRTSMDFAEVERLAGVKFRPNPNGKRTSATRDLVDRYTRTERKAGRRQGSVYGWHSLRHTFVVRALNAGVLAADVQRIVGHAAYDQTMEYYNPTDEMVAERVRSKMDPATGAASVAVGNPVLAMLQSMLANLSPDERNALLIQAAQGANLPAVGTLAPSTGTATGRGKKGTR